MISAILNIKQNVDSDWPLQIYDNSGKLHEIILAPGEMVWYESARLIHGRVEKLNGTSFENVFVHFMPKSKAWFQTDMSIRAHRPVSPITLETIKEADRALKEKKDKLKKEVEEHQSKFEHLDFEEKTKLRKQMKMEIIKNSQLEFDKRIAEVNENF